MPVTVSHLLAKFGGHRFCSSRDMFLFCHVIKQHHIIKGSGVYNNWNPLKVTHHTTKFGGHRHGDIDGIIL